MYFSFDELSKSKRNKCKYDWKVLNQRGEKHEFDPHGVEKVIVEIVAILREFRTIEILHKWVWHFERANMEMNR